MTQNPLLADQVIQLASQCVRCGLCLPKCPTYQINASEAESPRGRIALLAAIASGELAPSATVNQHIDQCLSCKSCETVCPAHVSYESLLIKGRALLIEQSPSKKPMAFFFRVLTQSSQWRRRLFALYRLSVKSGVLFLAQKSGLTRLLKLDRLLAYLPTPVEPAFVAQASYPVPNPRGTVALLLGCSSDTLEPQTIRDALKLLNHWGFNVVLPNNVGCCGALHAHAGELTDRFIDANTRALHLTHQQQPLDAILSLTTGCYSTWQSHVDLPVKVSDIQSFLLEQWPKQLTLNSLPGYIAVHEPCSQRNSLLAGSLSMRLLNKIPDLRTVAFGSQTCCGAAGDYFMKHPLLSDRLGQDLVATLPLELTGIASAYLGCRMQLAKQWHNKNLTGVSFYHTISLLAQALPHA